MVATPTKTLKFTPDVVAVLRNRAFWSDDGLSVTLPPLDKKLYQEIAKAFERMGGKWNRKAGATLFEADPRPQVEGLIMTGSLTFELDGFFRTPPAVTRYVMGRMALGMEDADGKAIFNFLEPSAGDGAIARVLIEEGYYPERIYCIERNASRCAELKKLGVRVANGDFLNYRNSIHIPFNRIIMNPPFEREQDIQHVWKAYSHLANNGVLAAIMSEGTFYRSTNTAKAFQSWLKSVGAYIEKLPERSFRESGTDVATRFIIIKKLNGNKK